jgi:ketosteroid isomerase-like protein
MTRLVSLGALPALLLAGCAPKTPAPLAANHARAISDSIHNTLVAYTDRLNQADRDSLIRFYADDPRFSWAADGQVATHSVAQVRAQFDALAGFQRWHVEYKDPTIVPLAPGLASVATEYQMSLADSTGKGVAFNGALTMLWINTPAGWKILGGHSSSPPRQPQ